MKRGDISFVSHEVRSLASNGQGNCLRTVHPFLALLSRDFVDACGYQIGLFGTLTARIAGQVEVSPTLGIRIAQLETRPFEFGSEIRMRDGEVAPSIWKLYSVSLTSLLDDGSITDEISGRWERPLSTLTHLLLSNDSTIVNELPVSRERARWVHPEVAHLAPGTRIRFRGNDLFVLSNAHFNRLHELGRVLVAPVIAGSRLHHAACANSGRIRIAFERLQAVEPFLADELEIIETTDSENEKLASTACNAARSFVSDSPFRTSRSDFIQYLASSRKELDSLSLPLVLSPLSEPAPVDGPKCSRASRTAPRPGRAFTQGVDVPVAGHDLFQIELSANYFEVFAERIENRLSLLIDARRTARPDNEVTFAWVEALGGSILATATPSPDPTIPVRLDVGTLSLDVPVDICIAVSTTYGLETARLKLQWSHVDT